MLTYKCNKIRRTEGEVNVHVVLNIIAIVATAAFLVVIGMKVFNLSVFKYHDGTWVIYNTEVYNMSDMALKDLKSEIDALTRKIDNSEKRVSLLKKENASLKALSESREEQILSLASLLEENGVAVKTEDKDNVDTPVHIVVRSDGMKEEKELVIKNSAEALNSVLIKESDDF